MFFEIFSFRAGYYKETEYDYAYSAVNYGAISALTYGFGLQIPLYKLAKIPMNINFDYTSLPQPPYTAVAPRVENFTTCNFRLNWIFKDKNQCKQHSVISCEHFKDGQNRNSCTSY
jgi:hypothetical protein